MTAGSAGAESGRLATVRGAGRSYRPMRRAAKVALFVSALAPAAYLAWGAWADALGANPIDAITDETGIWTLRFLLITLSITPLRRLTGWNALVGYRRMVGLFAFFYGTLHFLTWVGLDQFFAVDEMAADVIKRPFITVGFAAFALMVPLAITSTAGWIRRLGRRWQVLHRLVYVSAALGVVHYWWLVKADVSRPMRYAWVLGLLLGIRLVVARRRSLAATRRALDSAHADPAVRRPAGG
jgi:sulfoxide reductase heme-binding subunit YedZ